MLSDGEKPHLKCLINQKIDRNYVTKVLKSNEIPFTEISITKRATFALLLEMMTNCFAEEDPSISGVEGRLLIEEHVIEGAKLNQTLDEFGISKGQIIYVEYFDQENKRWPTDSVKRKQLQNPLSLQFGRSQGLVHLGDTCYMNSALQCLVNLRPFHLYFV